MILLITLILLMPCCHVFACFRFSLRRHTHDIAVVYAFAMPLRFDATPTRCFIADIICCATRCFFAAYGVLYHAATAAMPRMPRRQLLICRPCCHAAIFACRCICCRAAAGCYFAFTPRVDALYAFRRHYFYAV